MTIKALMTHVKMGGDCCGDRQPPMVPRRARQYPNCRQGAYNVAFAQLALQEMTPFMPAIYHHRLQVQDNEIDELQHANNAAYVNWMQAAAIAHSTAQGWPSERYWNASYAWVARSHMIEYLQPALAGDQLVVRTWVADMQRVSSLRRYEIRRETDDTILARAETRWAFINLKTRKPVRIPQEVQADFQVVSNGNGEGVRQ